MSIAGRLAAWSLAIGLVVGLVASSPRAQLVLVLGGIKIFNAVAP